LCAQIAARTPADAWARYAEQWEAVAFAHTDWLASVLGYVQAPDRAGRQIGNLAAYLSRIARDEGKWTTQTVT
jgi:hypothetical protein